MNIKAIAFDLDGTLLGSDDLIRTESIKAILLAKAKGIKIIICTGRPLEDALVPLKELPDGIFDFAVLNNGTYEYNFSDKTTILNGEIDKNILDIFKKVGKQYGVIFSIHILGKAFSGDLFQGDEPKWFKEAKQEEGDLFNEQRRYMLFKDIVEEIKHNKITQLSYRLPPTKIEEIQKKLVELHVDKEVNLYLSGSVHLDFTPKDINKDVGIKKLIKRLGIDISEVVTFGDSENDIEMLSNSGLGIAMGNAKEKAKEAADLVINNNDTDAIANKIREMVK